ncbi:MAG: hypothetical protein II359_03860 [Clostridia bacterium]|nr:hypothetical protein [Clostridia bacterium]
MKKIACLGVLFALLLCGCASQNEDGFVEDKTCITVTENTPIDLALCELVASSIEEGKEADFFEKNKVGTKATGEDFYPSGMIDVQSHEVEAFYVADADADGEKDYLFLKKDAFSLYNESCKKIFEKKCLAAEGGFFSYNDRIYLWQKGFHPETGIYHSVILYAVEEDKLVQTAEISRYGTSYVRTAADCEEYVAEAADAFASRVYNDNNEDMLWSEDETLENGVFYADFNNDGYKEGYFKTLITPEDGFAYIYPELLVNDTERMPFEDLYPLGLGEDGKIPVRFWVQEFAKSFCIFVISEKSTDGITKEADGFTLEGFTVGTDLTVTRFMNLSYEKAYAPKVLQK